MHIPLSWLNEFLKEPLSSFHHVSDLLTEAGLEVAGIEIITPGFDSVIVAEVLEVNKHPDADKLSLVRITDGTTEHALVTGASNCTPGMYVPFAPLDATVQGKKIKKATLRGIESYGMLLSAEEMGLENASTGIFDLSHDLKLGEPLAPYFSDEVIEIS